MLSFLGLCALTAIVIINDKFQNHFLDAIYISLNYEPLYPMLLCGSLLLGGYYSYFVIKLKAGPPDDLLFKIFGPLFDPPANALSFGIVIVSVLRLLRGIFCQAFFKEPYFKDFGLFDITAVSLTSFVLLVWGVKGLVKFFVDVFITTPTRPVEVEPANSEIDNGTG